MGTPRNFDEWPLEYYEVPEGMGVFEWGPTPDGSGPATQVHLIFGNPDKGGPVFLVRFKGTESLDRLIDALQKHRDAVFGQRVKP